MLVAWALGVAAGALVLLSIGVFIVALFWVRSIEEKWAAKYDEMHEAIGNLQQQIHQVAQFAGVQKDEFGNREIVGSLEGMERG